MKSYAQIQRKPVFGSPKFSANLQLINKKFVIKIIISNFTRLYGSWFMAGAALRRRTFAEKEVRSEINKKKILYNYGS